VIASFIFNLPNKEESPTIRIVGDSIFAEVVLSIVVLEILLFVSPQKVISLMLNA
jgi:hypothetical protein